jgi:hypothetical protein
MENQIRNDTFSKLQNIESKDLIKRVFLEL